MRFATGRAAAVSAVRRGLYSGRTAGGNGARGRPGPRSINRNGRRPERHRSPIGHRTSTPSGSNAVASITSLMS